MNKLADYIVPVSIDHAGRYPSKRPGDVWYIEMNGRNFRAELIGSPVCRPNGSILCDAHIQEIA